MSTDFVAVLCTVPGTATGARIARALVERELAACVNVVPGLTSVYRWEGQVQEEPEALLLIKTRRQQLGALEKAVRELHPYTVPELVALPIDWGSADYLSWLWGATGRKPA